VLDCDIGSGSISPLLVTGGKNGDITLHDLRFLSTGKCKHHRISTERDSKASSMDNTKTGTKGATTTGMIWHIPKAHLGNCVILCYALKCTKLVSFSYPFWSICRKCHQSISHPEYQLVFNRKQRWRCEAVGC
jgi:hypothetical protein